MQKKAKSLALLFSVCALIGVSSNMLSKPKANKIWVGIGYVASSEGASPGAGAAIGAIGVLDAAAWGFGVGMVAGPVAGAAAGVISGL
ncbi:hypothetical protein SAMN04487996_11787 [Dyadobacter soli]|uniref:Uncharacterized protein n=1 Tax=Dyadobacter soli TaxID=659014 RepID=A0A1G7T654_9BACT|nr:hypothetical protein [Dyadobacter soli]SDG30109.1 hypothetical protein SAMN04487996_11787 [Dyadobacter soli]